MAKKASDPQTSQPGWLRTSLAALDAGHDLEAMTALVEAWRETRSPAIAALCDVLDARLPEQIYANLVGKTTAVSVKRLQKVAKHEDPRLASAILGILARPPFISGAPEFWRLVARIAERHADPRLTESVADVLQVRLSPAGLRDDIVERIRALSGSKAKPVDEALIATLKTRLATERVTRESELLEEIYENPLDDGPRLVYADALLERGDPHGELITLQFKRRDHGLDDAEEAREQKLLKKHIRTWLRGLSPVVSAMQSYSSTRFERGFLAVADLQTSAEPRLPVTWRERAWATVLRLEGSVQLQRAVIAYAPLRALCRVEEVFAEQLPTLADTQRFGNVEEMELVHYGMSAAGWEQLTTFTGLPKLRFLEVMLDRDYNLADVMRLLEMPLARRLTRLVISQGFSTRLEEHETRHRALIRALASTPGPIAWLGIVPPWTAWPRPEPVMLEGTATGYTPTTQTTAGQNPRRP